MRNCVIFLLIIRDKDSFLSIIFSLLHSGIKPLKFNSADAGSLLYGYKTDFFDIQVCNNKKINTSFAFAFSEIIVLLTFLKISGYKGNIQRKFLEFSRRLQFLLNPKTSGRLQHIRLPDKIKCFIVFLNESRDTLIEKYNC